MGPTFFKCFLFTHRRRPSTDCELRTMGKICYLRLHHWDSSRGDFVHPQLAIQHVSVKAMRASLYVWRMCRVVYNTFVTRCLYARSRRWCVGRSSSSSTPVSGSSSSTTTPPISSESPSSPPSKVSFHVTPVRCIALRRRSAPHHIRRERTFRRLSGC